MRRIITGVRDGKSCVMEEVRCETHESQVNTSEFLRLPINPPAPRPPGNAAYLDLKVPVGQLRWTTVRFPPNAGFPRMHATDTIDCHTVVEGSIDLILDDGTHRLTAGDCVIIPGVDHAWQVGDEGCTTSALIIGTPAPA